MAESMKEVMARKQAERAAKEQEVRSRLSQPSQTQADAEEAALASIAPKVVESKQQSKPEESKKKGASKQKQLETEKKGKGKVGRPSSRKPGEVYKEQKIWITEKQKSKLILACGMGAGMDISDVARKALDKFFEANNI